MYDQVSLALIVLTAIVCWLAVKHALAAHRHQQQRTIAHAGATCLGKVVAVQRPFMLDNATRLYFDFTPDGTTEPVRACHIARAVDDATPRSLPNLGATVTIRYLPEHPERAVIGKLVLG